MPLQEDPKNSNIRDHSVYKTDSSKGYKRWKKATKPEKAWRREGRKLAGMAGERIT